MRVETSRFGTVEVDEERVIRFASGLVGMPEERRWTLLEAAPHGPRQGTGAGSAPLRWLQSLDHGDVALVVVDPLAFWPAYARVLDEAPAPKEAPAPGEEVPAGRPLLLCVAVVPPERPLETTVNLRAPLLIDPVRRVGRQVILEDERWPLRQPLFAPLAAGAAGLGEARC
ncbi:MAG: flagellar assembly protein FliW [Firmicutes bacterium]|nr:flagellar assembly protein FliW [Bacillota bacterium]